MTGLGSFPAGLFLFPEEKILGNSSFQQKEMHPLWTITIKRPNCKGIVQSMKIDFNCVSLIHFSNTVVNNKWIENNRV